VSAGNIVFLRSLAHFMPGGSVLSSALTVRGSCMYSDVPHVRGYGGRRGSCRELKSMGMIDT
jgi:hypothetical protein